MAIPSEYRAINSSDVGRVAGVNFSTTLRVYVPYTDYDPYNICAVEWSNGGYFGPGTTIDPDYTMLFYREATGYDNVPIYVYNTITGTGGGVETDYVYIPRGATITSVSAGSTWLYMLNINAYNVSFNLNGAPGTPPPTQSVGSGYNPTAVTPPTWTNHNFLGWSPSQYAAAGSPAESITITQNTTLYAIWKYTLYNVNYNTNGGNTISATVDVNALPNPLPTPTKEGYNFLGWYYDVELTVQAIGGTAINEDIKLYAKWTANLYNITYNANGGSPVAQTLNVTRFPTPLPLTAKAGYVFKGWWNSTFTIQYFANTIITANTTAYAKWEIYYHFNNMPQGYRTLRADDVDKVFGTELETIVYFDTSRFQNPTTFEIMSLYGGIELLGFQYNEVKPHVNGFGLVNDSVILDVFYEYDEVEATGEWLKPSKDLDGYQISEIVFGTQSAIYVKNKGSFDIIYQSNGGTTVNTTVGVYRFPTPLPSTYKTDFTFAGWWNLAYDKQYFAGELLLNNTTVYAKWVANPEIKTYNVTWNTNGGSPVAQMLGISRLPTPLPVTTKERSTFKGWYTNSLFIGEKAIDGQVVNANMTLYAKFVEAIKYELDDGTENVIEKIIQPYNPSSNKIINQNKYFLYAPAAGLDKVGMAGYKSGDFDVNSKQIVSISNKFKKTVVQNVDVNSIPDNIIYDGVDGIKTTNVFYNNYTNRVIDTVNTNNVPSYINVTGTLLVSLSNYVDDSNYSMSEMFIANGRIWTRVLVVVNDEVIEVTDFTQLGKQGNIDIPIQVGEIEPSNQRGIWLDESVEGVGVDDVIVVKGTDLQVVGNASGQIPVLQDLIVKGAEISLIEGSSGQVQISGGEITIVNAEGVEEILIDETLTVSNVDMVSGTKYITIKNVIPII